MDGGAGVRRVPAARRAAAQWRRAALGRRAADARHLARPPPGPAAAGARRADRGARPPHRRPARGAALVARARGRRRHPPHRTEHRGRDGHLRRRRDHGQRPDQPGHPGRRAGRRPHAPAAPSRRRAGFRRRRRSGEAGRRAGRGAEPGTGERWRGAGANGAGPGTIPRPHARIGVRAGPADRRQAAGRERGNCTRALAGWKPALPENRAIRGRGACRRRRRGGRTRAISPPPCLRPSNPLVAGGVGRGPRIERRSGHRSGSLSFPGLPRIGTVVALRWPAPGHRLSAGGLPSGHSPSRPARAALPGARRPAPRFR